MSRANYGDIFCALLLLTMPACLSVCLSLTHSLSPLAPNFSFLCEEEEAEEEEEEERLLGPNEPAKTKRRRRRRVGTGRGGEGQTNTELPDRCEIGRPFG